VAPNGDDSATGTLSAPFATIDHAPNQYNLYNFVQWQQTACEDINGIVADPLFFKPPIRRVDHGA
jgi:hypothetical protein